MRSVSVYFPCFWINPKQIKVTTLLATNNGNDLGQPSQLYCLLIGLHIVRLIYSIVPQVELIEVAVHSV